MKICLIQLKAKKGDVAYNLANHLAWIEKAGVHKPDLIVFPELSLTGYEPTLAGKLRFDLHDSRLEAFQAVSNRLNCTIAVGLPLHAAAGPQIAMLIVRPHAPMTTYIKQWLHTDEEPFFVPGQGQAVIEVGGTRVTPAICYESMRPAHLAGCLALGTQVYVASVAKHAAGMEKAHAYYAQIAARHQLPVLVVNSVGFCDNFMSAGHTAMWNAQGQLMDQLGAEEEGYLVYTLGS